MADEAGDNKTTPQQMSKEDVELDKKNLFSRRPPPPPEEKSWRASARQLLECEARQCLDVESLQRRGAMRWATENMWDQIYALSKCGLELESDPRECESMMNALLSTSRSNFDREVDAMRAARAGLPPPTLNTHASQLHATLADAGNKVSARAFKSPFWDKYALGRLWRLKLIDAPVGPDACNVVDVEADKCLFDATKSNAECLSVVSSYFFRFASPNLFPAH